MDAMADVSFALFEVPICPHCAVFDGHGGRQVAKYAEHHLLNYFKNSLLSEVDNNNSNDEDSNNNNTNIKH